MAIYIFIFVALIFSLYLIIDMFQMGNSNKFLDKWVRKVLWIWLPLFAIWRLTKEVFDKKKK